MRQRIWSFLDRLGGDGRSLWNSRLIGYRTARQIRVNRKARNWSQEELARRAGLSFATVCRLEKRSGSGVRNGSLTSLQKIANAFDCAFIGRFRCWGELVDELTCEPYTQQPLSPQTIYVASFNEELDELRATDQPAKEHADDV